MKEEKNYIHRRVCLCRQCGGRLHPKQKVCPQCQGSGRIWLSGEVTKYIEPYAEPEP